MSELLVVVPPFVLVALVAAIVPFVRREFGHALGVGVMFVTIAHVLLVPTGGHLPTTLFGFDVVLFEVDGISRLMGLIFGLIGAAAVTYSWGSRVEPVQTSFALGYVATSLGAVFAGDWLTLVFFWELMAITSTALVWHYGGAAVRAGYRYAVIHGIGGNLLLGAVVWQYATVGSFLFDAHPTGIVAGVPAILAALGIGVNVGFVGLHSWLPDTYPRPHVAASVFLCVYTTKTGVYAMYRAFPEGHLWIAYMGGAMAVFGVTLALVQSDMRRLLSYHIQSQVGYMVAGVGIGVSLATSGAFEHVFNHILYKSLLFMAVGVIIYRTGTEDLYELGGLWREMPVTAIAFTVGALSISGFPGFNGFISKGMVMDGSLYAGHELLWLMLLVGGLGTFLSFIKLGYYAFLHGPSQRSVSDATLGQTSALVVVSLLCVLLGVFPELLHALVPGTPADLHHYGTSHLAKGFGLAIMGVLGFALVQRTLKTVGLLPDVNRVTYPGGFYVGRFLVFGFTETYATVDRVVRTGAAWAYRFGADPVRGLDVVFQLAPPGSSIATFAPAEHGNTTYHLRSDIGRTILLLVVVTVLAYLWVAQPF